MKNSGEDLTQSAEKLPKEYIPADAPFSWDKLDGILTHKASLELCSHLVECPPSTIQDHILRRFGSTFTQYAEKNLSKTKIKLMNKAIEMALAGNVVMLIFCLKNICGWTDKVEQETNIKGIEIRLAYKEDD